MSKYNLTMKELITLNDLRRLSPERFMEIKDNVIMSDNQLRFEANLVPVVIDLKTETLRLAGFHFTIKILALYKGTFTTFPPFVNNQMLSERWIRDWIPYIIRILMFIDLIPKESKYD